MGITPNGGDLDGSDGFRIFGPGVGRGLAGVGDVNGDGRDDIGLMTAHGAVILFGRDGPWSAEVDAAALDGTDGFLIAGAKAVTSGGDVNGDGLADLLVSDATGSWLVFGTVDPRSPTLDPAALPPGAAIRIAGGTQDAASAGDINGDGFDDLVFARKAPGDRVKILTVLGAPDLDPIIDLGVPVPGRTTEFLYDGLYERFYSTNTVAGVGDLNGDGIGDFAIGSHTKFDSNSSVVSFIVFGQKDGFPDVVDLSELTPETGMSLGGGNAIAAVGDINGDGFGDMVFGWYQQHGSDEPYGGLATIILGGPTATDFQISRVTHVFGEASLGFSVAGVGDVTGDGLDDFVVGRPLSGYMQFGGANGSAFVFFGREDGFRDLMVEAWIYDCDDLDRPQPPPVTEDDAFEVFAPRPPQGGANKFGEAAAGIGDVNGDGAPDFIIGAPGSASAYVFFGIPNTTGTTSIVVHAAGTGDADEAPSFELFADGVSLGHGTIAAPGADRTGAKIAAFEFTMDGPPPDRLEIVYANDGCTPSGVDLNLFVDRVTVGAQSFEAEIDGFFTPANGNASRMGPREALFWNGTLAFDLPGPQDGPTKTLTVFAGGSGDDANRPRFVVRADGVTVGSAEIAAPQHYRDARRDGYQTDAFEFAVAADADPSTIEIFYVNDRTDRAQDMNMNLHVTGIAFDGQSYASAEDGFFTPSADKPSLAGPHQTLHVNGVLAFELDA